MALVLDFGKDTIEVISSKDEAVSCDAETYQRYLESLDEGLLGLRPDCLPTRFVMRKLLSFGMAQKIKSEQAGVNQEGRIEIKFGFTLDDVRAALIDIKNPGSDKIAFKKDSDGYASKELIAVLDQVGIANELYAARQAAIKTNGSPKKS